MRYRHFIWDFDGTLFDSYPHMAQALLLAARDQGAEVTLQEIWVPIKRSVGEARELLCAKYGLDPQAMREGFHRHEEGLHVERVQPYPGSHAVCRFICENGGQNYIYTHRNDSAWQYLGHFGMAGDFVGGVTSRDGFPSKPAPDALLYLMQTHGLNPAETLMIGDREVDVLSGHNAGIASCLLDPDGIAGPCEVEWRFADFQAFMEALQQAVPKEAFA